MHTKWNLLMVVILLAALVGGNTGAALAQEIHYFTWDPPAPQEGSGLVVFTATPPAGYASLEWSRSSDPGGTCDLGRGTGLSFSTQMLESGVYQVCLKITFPDGTSPEINDVQPVTVENLPPTLGTAMVTPATSATGYPVTASVPVSDFDSGLACTVDFGDGTDPVDGTLNDSCTALHPYTTAGTYTVTFTVSEPGLAPVTAAATHTVVGPYAKAVLATAGSVQNGAEATGAPDSIYASIRASSGITLDLGAQAPGATLTIYHSARSASCAVFLADATPAIGATKAGADRTTLIVPTLYPGSQSIRIQCGTVGKKAIFELDAIQVEPPPVPTGYAIWATPYIGDVQNAGAVVGAPDGIYGTIGAAGGTIMVDMGGPLSGILTVYHSTDSPACQVLWGGQYPLGTTLPGATSTSLIVPSFGENIPGNFSIECAAGHNAVFELDAVKLGPTMLPTGYALATWADGTENAAAATGEPDGQYAMMGVTSSSSHMLLDMGDVVQGSILTIYHSSASPSCTVAVSSALYSAELQPLGATTAGWESSIFEISQDFRYVYIVCELGMEWSVFELDAVHVGTVADLGGYAIAAYDGAGGVQNLIAAVGAPDKEYATLIDGAEALLLDLGVPMRGMLTVYHSSKSQTCAVVGTPTPDFTEPVFLGGALAGMESSDSFLGEDYRYIWIYCSLVAGEVFELDAIHVDSGVTPTGYALTAFGDSEVENMGAAVGAPDRQYATMAVPGSYQIVLDLGAVQQGRLAAYLGQMPEACSFTGTKSLTGSPAPEVLTPLGWGAYVTFSIPEAGIRYVWIDCTLAAGEVFELDAIHAIPVLEPNGYGLMVLAASEDVQNPDAATGEPDGAYATVTAQNGALLLDIGELVQGVLTVYHSKTSPACVVLATPDLSEPGQQPGVVGMTLPGVEQTTILLTADSRYIYFICGTLPKGTAFQLDAVHVEPGIVTPTGYGMAVLTVSGKVQNPFAATEQPDNVYATISAPSGVIVLDLGAVVQGSLTVYHSTTSPSCTVALTDVMGGQPSPIGTTTAGATSTLFELTSGQYRYVVVACSTLAKKQVFQLDAVHVTLPTP